MGTTPDVKGAKQQNATPSKKPDRVAGEGMVDVMPLPGTTGRAPYISVTILVLSLLSGFATYFILLGLTPIVPTFGVVITVLFINAVLVLAMIALILRQVVGLLRAKRKGLAGSRLHVRFVSLFGGIAALPLVLLAIFASLSLDRGLDRWFSTRTQAIIQDSLNVSRAYVYEHANTLRKAIAAMAADINNAAPLLRRKGDVETENGATKQPSGKARKGDPVAPPPETPGRNESKNEKAGEALGSTLKNKNLTEEGQKLEQLLEYLAALQNVPYAYLLDAHGKVVAKSATKKQAVFPPPSPQALSLAKAGGTVVITPISPGRPLEGRATTLVDGQWGGLVRALKRLDKFPGHYLYVVRPLDPRVIRYLNRTRANVREYRKMERSRTGYQFAFGMMYVAIALTLLLAAIWMGLWFANRLVSPIRRLIAAAQQVSEGNLNTSVSVSPSQGDLAKLGATFNNMTAELRSQRNELLNANAQLDERRRFIEAVLSGVTAGVIGVDMEGRVRLLNPSAEAMLAVAEKEVRGRPLEEVLPAFAPLLAQARKPEAALVQEQLDLVIEGRERHFAVRVTQERSEARDYGYIITFDDITELVTAQRMSAWADVARRIAHEIKNPLTPIQLSAERIRRKYGHAITKDREIFDKCTDTIIRHVGDIGRMVDEFSAFARMPKPVMERHDVGEIAKEALLLFQMSHGDITFQLDLPPEPLSVMCDRRLISQAITNLVKNATEAIATVAQEREGAYEGRIRVQITQDGDRYVIAVVDNGCGLPKEERNRLVEPYRTTRAKGTGLGLAIVKKIAEQHGGSLVLEDAPSCQGESQGACVKLILPRVPAMGRDAENVQEQKSKDMSGEAKGATVA